METPTIKRSERARPILPSAALGQCLLPFALPILVTLVIVLTIGEAWPRNIAPGSGLKLAGLVATALTAAGVWRWATRQVENRSACRFVAMLCGMTALMGWPVWSVGVLPSINGMALGPAQQTPMRLERLEITTTSRGGRGVYHWAWLVPLHEPSPIAPGRVFIPADVHAKWDAAQPKTVTLRHAQGLLGAEVLTGFE